MPSALVINKGGTYTGGTYTTVTINHTGAQVPVVLDQLKLVGPGDLIYVNTDCPVTITNCVGSTNAPHKFLVGNTFKSLDVENNLLNGTSGMVTWCPSAVSQIFKYNEGYNITGATSATTRNKTSFIQVDLFHSANLEIAWNYVKNLPGLSAVEDTISLASSGGVNGSPALIHDNFIDGAFMYPAPTTASTPYSGGGIMTFDPGADFNVTYGGYTKCYNNQVIGTEHYGIDLAGSHDIEICGNRVVNDGTQSKNPGAAGGIRTFNWDNKSLNMTNISVHDNYSVYNSGVKNVNYTFMVPTIQSNNLTGTSTEDGERASWTAKVAAAGVVIGPMTSNTPAVNLLPAIPWTSASVDVKQVPLASEKLGPPVSAGYCVDGDWIQYANMDFGTGVNYCLVSLGAPVNNSGSIEFHLDSITGPLIGTLTPASTGGWYNYQVQTIPAVASGVHDLYLVFRGTSAGIANFHSLQFVVGTPAVNLLPAIPWTSASVDVKPVPLASENSGPPVAAGYCNNGDWIQYAKIDFGTGVKTVGVSLGVIAANAGQTLELHTDSVTGPLIGTLSPVSTGGWYTYQVQSASAVASGLHDLYLVFKGKSGICNVNSIQFS